jgi:hypothetical protein
VPSAAFSHPSNPQRTKQYASGSRSLRPSLATLLNVLREPVSRRGFAISIRTKMRKEAGAVRRWSR